MIGRLSGTVWAIEGDLLVLRVGGVGFQVRVPSGTLARLREPGQPVELFTHLHVRENELVLYGFLTQEEVSLFHLLLSVSGVGPKTALALISTVAPDTVRQAVLRDEPGLLSRVPGIGPKTARAIIFHLKDRLAPLGAGAAGPVIDAADAEVIAALTGVGFSLVEAQTALQSLPRGQDLPFEERLRLALSYFAGPRS